MKMFIVNLQSNLCISSSRILWWFNNFSWGPDFYIFVLWCLVLALRFISYSPEMAAPTPRQRVLRALPQEEWWQEAFFSERVCLFIRQVEASHGLPLVSHCLELCPPLAERNEFPVDLEWSWFLSWNFGGGGCPLPSLWSRCLFPWAGRWRGLSAGLTVSSVCLTSHMMLSQLLHPACLLPRCLIQAYASDLCFLLEIKTPIDR